mmetsp:Transcript_40674/g.129280  ORF Transcript_40674/g.129280 Transcript_40674/m.129280 type:complete len:336 (+) Transcript_40674:23-1030(+)
MHPHDWPRRSAARKGPSRVLDFRCAGAAAKPAAPAEAAAHAPDAAEEREQQDPHDGSGLDDRPRFRGIEGRVGLAGIAAAIALADARHVRLRRRPCVVEGHVLLGRVVHALQGRGVHVRPHVQHVGALLQEPPVACDVEDRKLLRRDADGDLLRLPGGQARLGKAHQQDGLPLLLALRAGDVDLHRLNAGPAAGVRDLHADGQVHGALAGAEAGRPEGEAGVAEAPAHGVPGRDAGPPHVLEAVHAGVRHVAAREPGLDRGAAGHPVHGRLRRGARHAARGVHVARQDVRERLAAHGPRVAEPQDGLDVLVPLLHDDVLARGHGHHDVGVHGRDG